MEIQVGDRITYKFDGILFVETINNLGSARMFKTKKERKILKIERPKYEVVEEKEEILDQKEKEYLWNVIKPFKDKVECIVKTSRSNECGEFIGIYVKGVHNTYLPIFKKGTMYKGMKLNKAYTLEELGLIEGEME